MRNMITAIAFLFLFATNGAQAAGLAMAKDLPPETAASVLAINVEHSLVKDKSGNAIIEGTECTTPNMIFDAIHEMHPSAKLGSVSELPAYLRTLVRKQAPSDAYRMSRIIQHGKVCKLDARGWARAFFAGEYAWFDPNTGEAVLAGDCGNIVGERVQHKVVVVPPPHEGQCIEHDFDALRGDQVNLAEFINQPISSDCGPARWNGLFWESLDSPCGDTCNFAGPRSAIPNAYQPLHAFAYVIEGPVDKQTGRIHERIRLNSAMRTQFLAVCLTRHSMQSDADVVTPVDWAGKSMHRAPATWPMWGTTANGDYVLPAQ